MMTTEVLDSNNDEGMEECRAVVRAAFPNCF